MSTFLNGGDEGGRQRPKAVPVPVSRDEISRAITKSATAERETKQRSLLADIGVNFLHLLQDFGFHSGRMHKRYRPRESTRAPVVVCAEVRKFYSQRPRPWCSPNARARLMRKARRRDAERRAT
jgi:hypothetical protein